MNKDKTWRNELFETCKILYCMKNKSMRETCMCWGFECGDGWKEPLISLSSKLEALNLQYWPKYRIRIQADQVKEKFGTLRFYWTLKIDNTPFRNAICNSLYWLNRKLFSNNSKSKISDIILACAQHFDVFPDSYTTEQRIYSQYISDLAEEYVKETEDKCFNVCEECGSQIGTDYSKRCMTTGWITYICKKCADKSKHNYVMDDELWNDDKCIMNKEQYAKSFNRDC